MHLLYLNVCEQVSSKLVKSKLVKFHQGFCNIWCLIKYHTAGHTTFQLLYSNMVCKRHRYQCKFNQQRHADSKTLLQRNLL